MTFVCPPFLHLTSLFSVIFHQCCAKIFCLHQRKIVQDCKYTLHQHWDGKQSLIYQQQSVLYKGNVFYWRYWTSADPLMVFFLAAPPPHQILWTGHCRASVPFGLSFTVEQPSMWSKWNNFQAECGELMRCAWAQEIDSVHGCFSAFAALKP